MQHFTEEILEKGEAYAEQSAAEKMREEKTKWSASIAVATSRAEATSNRAANTEIELREKARELAEVSGELDRTQDQKLNFFAEFVSWKNECLACRDDLEHAELLQDSWFYSYLGYRASYL